MTRRAHQLAHATTGEVIDTWLLHKYHTVVCDQQGFYYNEDGSPSKSQRMVESTLISAPRPCAGPKAQKLTSSCCSPVNATVVLLL
jgi:hypothetical protein